VDSIQGILHCREVEDAVNPIAPQTGTILLSVEYLQSCTIAFRLMTTQNRSTDRVPATHPPRCVITSRTILVVRMYLSLFSCHHYCHAIKNYLALSRAYDIIVYR